jgi:hypothetical protein
MRRKRRVGAQVESEKSNRESEVKPARPTGEKFTYQRDEPETAPLPPLTVREKENSDVAWKSIAATAKALSFW